MTFHTAKAGHILGGEINYEYLGNNEYHIWVDMYFEPENLAEIVGTGNADDFATLALYENSGSFSVSNSSLFTFPLIDTSSFETKFQQCSSDTLRKRVKKFTYGGNQIIPSNPNGYILTYIRCCRDETNFVNINEDLGLSLSAIIRPNNQSNNTPLFINEPPRFVCQGNAFEFDMSCTDSDGDVLKYSIVAPRDGGSSIDVRHEEFDIEAHFFPPFDPIVYPNGYWGDNPFGNNDVTINENTGLLKGTADQLGDYFVAIQIEEYRSRQLIGTRIRDFAVSVENCQIPIAIAEVNSDTANPVYVCLNEELIFDASNSFSSGSNIKSYAWDFDYEGNTASSMKTTFSYDKPGAYYPTLKVIDQGDCESKNKIHYIVNVGTKPSFQLNDTTICQFSEYCFDVENEYDSILVEGSYYKPMIESYAWLGQFIDNPNIKGACITPSQNGQFQYLYTITDNHNCTFDTSIIVQVDEAANSFFAYNDSIYCKDGTSPYLIAKETDGGVFFENTGLLNIDSNSGSLSLSNAIEGDQYQIEYLIDGTCPSNHFHTLIVAKTDSANFNFNPNQFCKNSTLSHIALLNADSGIFTSTVGLNFSDNSTGLIDLSKSNPGVYTIQLLTNGFCKDSMSFEIEILANDDPAFRYDKDRYCKYGNDPLLTIPPVTNGNFSEPSGILTSFNSQDGLIDLSQLPAGPDDIYIDIMYTTNEDCPNDTTVQILVYDKANTAFDYQKDQYCVYDTIALITTDSNFVLGTFSCNDTNVILKNTLGSIDLINTPIGGPYLIFNEDFSDCASKDSATIYLNPNDDPRFSYDANLYCQGGQNPIVIDRAMTGTFESDTSLHFLDESTGEILFPKSKDGLHTIYHTTDGICPMMDSLIIDIAPKLFLSFKDVSIFDQDGDYDLNQLIKTGNLDGTWSGERVNNGNFDPINLFGYYDLTYKVENRACTLEQTHPIHVYGDPRYFFPNVFTPNGDQINDVFISRGIFEGIQSYSLKIFNRYGEFIFESDDPLIGWNGIHENKRSPEGIYLYVLEIINYRGGVQESSSNYFLLLK